MPCEEMEELLSAYIDRETSAEEAREVVAHVDRCQACARHVRFLERTRRIALALPVPPMPADLRRRLMAAAPPRRSLADWLALSWQIKPLRYGLVPAMALASVLVIHSARLRNEALPIEAFMSAHREYALTMPLAPTETLLSGRRVEDGWSEGDDR